MREPGHPPPIDELDHQMIVDVLRNRLPCLEDSTYSQMAAVILGIIDTLADSEDHVAKVRVAAAHGG